MKRIRLNEVDLERGRIRPSGLVPMGVLCLVVAMVWVVWGVHGLTVDQFRWSGFVFAFFSVLVGMSLIRIGLWTDWMLTRLERLEAIERRPDADSQVG